MLIQLQIEDVLMMTQQAHDRPTLRMPSHEVGRIVRILVALALLAAGAWFVPSRPGAPYGHATAADLSGKID